MADVSVIIPTWNRGETLERAIRSVLAQTIPIREILVCDDGSDDNSRSIVSHVKDDRIKWCPGLHAGRPAVPRNRGIAQCKGEWIAFLDSDDEWFPTKLSAQLPLIERLGCKAACANALRRRPNGECEAMFRDNSGEIFDFFDLLKVNRVVTSSAIVHRSLFDCVVGFPEDSVLVALEDYALWLRVATVTKFAYVSTPQVAYTDNPSESLRSKGHKLAQQRVLVFRDFLNWTVLHGTNIPGVNTYSSAVKRERRKAAFLGTLEPFRHMLKEVYGRLSGKNN